MTARSSRTRILGQLLRRKHPRPAEFPVLVRVLPLQSVRQKRRSEAIVQIALTTSSWLIGSWPPTTPTMEAKRRIQRAYALLYGRQCSVADSDFSTNAKRHPTSGPVVRSGLPLAQSPTRFPAPASSVSSPAPACLTCHSARLFRRYHKVRKPRWKILRLASPLGSDRPLPLSHSEGRRDREK
jgi:hypothetical protein